MLLTDSIAPLISRIDIDEFETEILHEIVALVESFARKYFGYIGLKSRFHEAAEPKRGAFFIDLIASHVDGSKLADLQRCRKSAGSP